MILTDELYVPNSTVERHGLDAYYPDGTGPLRTVVFVHGGGWKQQPPEVRGHKEDFADICEQLMAKQYAAFSVNYKVGADSYFDAISDLATAIETIKTFPCVNPNRMSIWGESAGGHIAAAMVNGHHNVRACITNCAPWNVEPDSGNPANLIASADAMRGNISAYNASPINFVSDVVPFINIRAVDDQIVTENCFSARLKDMNAKSREIACTGNHVLIENPALLQQLYVWLLGEASFF